MSEKTKSPTRRVAEEYAATIEEINAAFEALTRADMARLKFEAQARINVLGRKARGRSWEDLLQQAFHDIWKGNRRWNKTNVDFIGFLRGAIESIASSWGNKYKRQEAALKLGEGGKINEIPLYQSDEDEEPIPLPSMEADPERTTLAKIEVERLEQIAQDHLHACFILDDIKLGMGGPEIQKDLGITKNDYESAMKWMRRNFRN